MNFEFFAFLVFMSFVSFAVAFLAYGMVVRFMGKDGFLARVGQIILVPACIVIYDFITMAAPQSNLLPSWQSWLTNRKSSARNLPASTKKEKIAAASNSGRIFCAKAEYIT